MNIKTAFAIAAISLGMGGFSGAASAAELTYDTWTTNEGESGNYILTVDDNTVGEFNFSLTVDPWNAEALGLFIDLGSNDIGVPVVITNVATLPVASTVDLVATDTASDSCGPGCNLNGLSIGSIGDGEWELVFRLGDQGWDGVQSFSFTTNNFGLALSDFGLVGIRAQQLCTGDDTLPSDQSQCNGSDKSVGSSGPNPPPPDVIVPEPGTIALAAIGLLGLGGIRRKAQA
ncbi:MAG: PEP-CTERM sorting domain-containing protein [Motiliproteus sp.]